jgi:uncharacterized coiled-coil protein SlyX
MRSSTPVLATSRGGEIMKIGNALLIGVLVVLGLSASQVAEAGGQAGGIPSLDARVSTLETTVADQGTAGAALQTQVDDLQTQVNGVQNDVATLESKLPVFAVIERDATLRPNAHRGVQRAEHFLDQDGNPIAGAYKVFFDRPDVSRCAVTVTAEPEFGSPLTAIVNGTFRGFPSPSFPSNMFTIEVFDKDNDRIDARFNIIVMC